MNTPSDFFSLVKALYGFNAEAARAEAARQAQENGLDVRPVDSDALRTQLLDQLGLKDVSIEVNIQVGIGPVDDRGRYNLVDAICIHRATPAGQFSFVFIAGSNAPVYTVFGGNGLSKLAAATQAAIVAFTQSDKTA